MLLLLGVVALLGLKPWATSSLAPDVSVSPDLGAALGDAAVVAQTPAPAIADARVAGGRMAAVAARPVAYEPAPRASRPAMGVGQGQVVRVAEATPATPPPPAATPPASVPPQPAVAAPAPPPSSPSPPVLAGIDEEGAPGQPGTAGSGGGQAPPPACEGDEYEVTITYEVDEATGERLPTEILIRRIESDGSVSELHLEGDLADYNELIAALVADGGCVEVEPVPASPEGEGVEEAPDAVLEAGVPGETLEPVLP